MFPYAEVINFPICHSDHSPILLKFGSEKKRREKLFNFDAMWLSKDECGKVALDAWKNGIGELIYVRVAKVDDNLTHGRSVLLGS